MAGSAVGLMCLGLRCPPALAHDDSPGAVLSLHPSIDRWLVPVPGAGDTPVNKTSKVLAFLGLCSSLGEIGNKQVNEKQRNKTKSEGGASLFYYFFKILLIYF